MVFSYGNRILIKKNNSDHAENISCMDLRKEKNCT